MPSWADREERYMSEYRGESRYDRPPRRPCPGCGGELEPDGGECVACAEPAEATAPDWDELAQQVIDAAFDEAAAQGAGTWELDYTTRGERILRQHIAEALRAIRQRAA